MSPKGIYVRRFPVRTPYNTRARVFFSPLRVARMRKRNYERLVFFPRGPDTVPF